MKKLFFLAISLAFVLSSCFHLDSVTPDDNSSSTSSSNHISLSSVPQSAKDFVASNYSSFSITAAEKELEHGAVQYKLTIEQGSNKKRLIFNASWQFLNEKN